MEVYDDDTYAEVDRDYYKSIRIVFELKKIDKFNVNRVDLNIGNMKSYSPFTWKNIQHTSCYFDSGYYNYWSTSNYNTKIFKCDFSLPSNYDYNDITAFQFDKIVGYKKPIKIFSIIFEPVIRLKNSIFNLFSRS